MNTQQRIIIIGGGLSGLALAYKLAQQKVQATILEAASRTGGRIQTIKGALDTPMELGATWFSDMHPHLLALIESLGLKKFPQYSKGISLFQTKSFEPAQQFFVPEADSPSYRIAGGTEMLIQTLQNQLPSESIHLNTKVVSIKDFSNELQIETSDGKMYQADKVILCMPPQLVGAKIQFSPVLPEALSLLLPAVQTWMAGSIKFAVEYEKPFWREKGFSGMLYSHAGIVIEMYDHTNVEEDKFGFTGFLNGGAFSYKQEVRKEFVLRQLSELLGEEAAQPVSYHDKVWNDAYVSGGQQVILRPHQYNGHPLFQQSYMDGKLFFCGTETDTEFAGYMEGAVRAAQRMAVMLMNG
jgi:monoamine oxidase